MLLTEILTPERIVPHLDAAEPEAVLEELVRRALIGKADGLTEDDASRVIRVLKQREVLGSTAIKDGLAIPHGKVSGLTSIVAGMGIHRAGLPFGALDDKPSHIFIVLLSPDAAGGHHLKALARIARLFHDGTLQRRILNAKDADGIYNELATEDARY